MFSRQKVVVTGGAGFIGSHIVDRLVEANASVTVIDNFSTGRESFLNPAATLVRGDLLDQSLVDRAVEGATMVFHLAANADIKDGLKHPRRDVEQNVLATQNVLEAMRKAGVQRIAFSSTGSVYGEPSVFPTPEDAPFPVQTSLYATSKVAAEGLLTSYALGYGFQSWIFRFVSILGPRYTHGHVFDFWRKLRQDPTSLHILGDGRQLKSYCHVSDCVDGIFLAVAAGHDDSGIRIYNIGRDDMLEVNTSVSYICRELGVAPQLTYSGGARGWVGDSPKILLDAARLRRLGWSPKYSLEASVVDTLQYLVQHPEMAPE
ncbi:MAG: NAD-dependent epimerase/dehydratase family protein [Polyangiaceae bacterium]|nr:NAD-dependent epimerase/dehydratase family protein [Polyangiaceae bacterium]